MAHRSFCVARLRAALEQANDMGIQFLVSREAAGYAGAAAAGGIT